MGLLALRLGDCATARDRYQSSLEHQRGWGWILWAIRSLAGLAATAGDQAERALGEGAGFQLPAPEREVMERAVAYAL
jgi:hypothetical protein